MTATCGAWYARLSVRQREGTVYRLAVLCSVLVLLALASARGQVAQPPATPAQSIAGHFAGVNQRILEMAKDFPADKYTYHPTPEVRTFADVIVHVLSGNVYAAKAGRGEKVSWDEVDPKSLHGKTEIVAALEKSIADATATLKATPPERFAQTPEPWLSVIEHSAEHYGQLVVYYRGNGLVPPASRPKKP
jgi:uncharacterized damage-inducible protein DinB